MKTTSGRGAGRRTGGAIAETTGTEIMTGNEGGVMMMARRMKRNAGVERTRRGGDASARTKSMIAGVRSAMIEIGTAIDDGRGVASTGGVDRCRVVHLDCGKIYTRCSERFAFLEELRIVHNSLPSD